MRLLRILLLIAALEAGSWAQTPNKPLTNSDIESMLVAGLPEGTILTKIERAVNLGFVDLNASTAALIVLKASGAGEQVLNAVIWAEPFGAELKREQQEDLAVPGLPGSAGVFYKAPSGWVTLGSFLLWPPLYSGWNAFSRRSHEHDVTLAASHADLQISEPQPTFYLRKPASDGWRVVRLESRDDRRLLRLVSGGDFFAKDKFPASEAREVQIASVTGQVFTLQPVAPLESGEYLLCSEVPGGATLNVCYGFGVRH
jgi:hypothetical protein